MKKNEKQAYGRWFSVAMAIMLLFSYGWTGLGNADAKSKSGASESLHKTKVQSQNKINKDLEKNFKKQDQVTFLLKFKDQVNTKKVAKNALSKKQKKNTTAAKADVMKRSAIVSALRSKSLETQYDVKDILKEQKKAGNVKDFKSYYIVNMMAVTGTKKVAEKLAKMGQIEKVLPNRTRHIIKPVEKKAGKKAGAKANTQDDSIEPNIKHIGAPEAWEQGIDGDGTVIADLDTGVQWDHPALKEKYRGYHADDPDNPDHEMNWYDATAGEDTPNDDDGHGTHTMGTMVGSESDDSNQIGVAPGAQWIAVKAFTEEGATDDDLLDAGEWLLAPKDDDGNPHADKAPDVINNSWGGGAGKDEFYRDMVENWREAGIFPSFAAGNTTLTNPGGPGSVASPGNYPESFAVGATNNDDELADFSLQGPSPYDEIKPDVAAPGVNIRSSVPGSDYDGTYSGTSMATPLVTGTIALLRQADASLSVNDLEDLLMDTAKPLTDDEFPESPNNGYGHGGLKAGNAVASVISGLGKVQGQVTKEGEDNEPPEYDHDAVDKTYEGMDLPLAIDVTDNVGITKVELQYRQNSDDDWTTVEADKTAGNHLDASYVATIPGDDIEKPSLSYQWKINDYGDNEVTSDVYDVEVESGISVGYEEDFESTPTGWTSFGDNDSWEWGEPTSGPEKAYSGDKVYATNLDGDYDSDADATLRMPSVNVPEDGDAYLQYKQWYNLEDDWDYGHMLASTDGEEWDQLDEVNGESEGWEDGEIDLSDYAGEGIYLAFHLDSDVSNEHAGLYIDDVVLSDESLDKDKTHLGVEPRHDGNSSDDLSSKEKKAASKKEGKKKPDAGKMRPGKVKNLQSPFTAMRKDSKKADKDNDPASLPVEAKVSVQETDSYTNTDPADGSYSLTQPTGEYTLKAESYGFESETQTVDIEKDETSTADFELVEIPKGTISGTITDKQTGNPVENATVSLAEDSAVKPVETNDDGHYSLKAYEGDYTLHVGAQDYHITNKNITIDGDEDTIRDVELKPFIGTPGEIGYDDGTPENALAFLDPDNARAVRMSLDEGQDDAMVTGGKFQFTDDNFPDPGGTEFQVEIWDASGDDGAPGEKLAGPVDATAIRDEDKWTKIDLDDERVTVDGDFYMVYRQSAPGVRSPGLSTDQNSPNTERGLVQVDGDWLEPPADEGNYMIRAMVDYEVDKAKITSPKNGSYTNDDSIKVVGESSPDVNITVSNNGDEVVTTSTNNDGKFSTNVDLEDGDNELTATASTDAGTIAPSDPVTVTLDQDKPDLTVDSPGDRTKTNNMAVNVKGTASDDNLDWVKVNGKKEELKDDGSYSHRMLLDAGENNIKDVAQDKAGNQTEKTRTVFAKFDAPEISNLTPTEGKHLNPGASVIIEMDSEPGLNATFAIRMPLANGQSTKTKTSSIDELPMMEIREGHYRGVWTATTDLTAKGAKIEVTAHDDYGNKTQEEADGELFINVNNQKSSNPK